MPTYLYRIVPPRPDFAQTLSDDEAAAMARHFAYLKAQHAAGRLVFTGRTDSGSIGISVFTAADAAEAQAMADGDPAKQTGVIDIVVEPFHVVDFDAS